MRRSLLHRSRVRRLPRHLASSRIGLFTACVFSFVPAEAAAEVVSILFSQGRVTWEAGPTVRPLHPGDAVPPEAIIATGPNARATLSLGGLGLLRMAPESRVSWRPAREALPLRISCLTGRIYVFDRRADEDLMLEYPGGQLAAAGAELALSVSPGEDVALDVLARQAEVRGPERRLTLRPDDEGRLAPETPPARGDGIGISPRMQWLLYYPAVLEPEDLPLDRDDSEALGNAWQAYRTGDAMGALAAWPSDGTATSPAAAVFQAALLLSVGRVEAAENVLDRVPADSSRESRLAYALRTHIAAVRGLAPPPLIQPITATEWLVESYRHQAQADLADARAASAAATRLLPAATFAWARLAEMEFSFGRTQAARVALSRARSQGPQHAPGAALVGFMQAARQDYVGAEQAFREALRLDGALGTAWLGLGLVQLAQDNPSGLSALAAAAGHDPNRSLWRSYLGMAFSDAAQADPSKAALAAAELARAQRQDPGDPTPWLYSAVHHKRRRELNAAARDLMESIDRNDHRAAFRSRFLLDQDAAVRGTNLATIFGEVGFDGLALSEAAHAVTTDPASATAHAFLSAALDARRDPYRVSLRHETAWFNERLTANLLAPVGAGSLSPLVSEGEYSRLFSHRRIQGFWDLELTHRGGRRVIGSLGGQHGRAAWSVDVDHFRNEGPDFNDDIRRTEVFLSGKHMLGDASSAWVMVKFKTETTGDVAPRVRGEWRDPDLRLREDQRPLWFAALQHAWAPEEQTLLLLSQVENQLRIFNPDTQPDVLRTDAAGSVASFSFPHVDLQAENRVRLPGVELRHLSDRGAHGWTGGARYQKGYYTGQADLRFLDPEWARVAEGRTTFAGRETLRRASAYLHVWRSFAPLSTWTAGLSVDDLQYPRNLQVAPYAAGTSRRRVWGPRFGLVQGSPTRLRVRATWSRALSGFDIDDPIQLEPNVTAGFVTRYRAVIPEALAGSVPADRIDVAGVAFERRQGKHTFASLGLTHVRSGTVRELGAYTLPLRPELGDRPQAAGFAQTLAYREATAELRVDRLIGRQWSVGAEAVWQRAELRTGFPDWVLPLSVAPRHDRVERGDLLQLRFRGRWQSARGPFGALSVAPSWQRRVQPGQSRAEVIADVQVGWRLGFDRGTIALACRNALAAGTGFNPINSAAAAGAERIWTVQSQLRF